VSDPFAEQPTPWWRRLKRGDRRTYAPKRVAAVASAIGGTALWILPHHHSLAVALLAATVAALPAGLIESWYKRRHRREEEQLFVLPETQRVTTRVEAR
jgi:hypothetical protein